MAGSFGRRDDRLTADNNMDWRRKGRPVATPRREQRDEQRGNPKPPVAQAPKKYSPPAAPWASAAAVPQQSTADARAFPSLAEASEEPQKAWATPTRPESAVETPVEEVTERKSLKPKPQKNYSIFDVVKSAATPKKQPAPPRRVEDDKPTPEPALEPSKPKKKRLTSLKKRILMDRVERYYAAHPDERPTARVWLLNAARASELEDEDEREEILRDVSDICRVFAVTHEVRVVATRDVFATIEVAVGSADDADRLIVGLKDRVLGGERLRVVRAGKHLDEPRPTVRLAGVLSESEVEDDEELEEAMADLRALCEKTGSLESFDRDGLDCLARYSDPAHAKAAVELLATTRLNGDLVVCKLEGDAKQLVALRGVVSHEALQDDDEVKEIEGDIEACASQRGAPPSSVKVGTAGDVLLEYADVATARQAVDKLAGLVLGGDLIRVEFVDEQEEQDEEDEDLAIFESKTTPGGLVKLPLKYARARRVPKMAGETKPDYAADQPRDAVIDDLVATLLGKLFEFQERVRINEPLKAKMRRRLVFGLREVRRGIRANNVKCLVVAPNVDDGDALNAQIDDLLSAANEASVPVVFALGKRKLGRALRKKVGVSAVGIYSGDGAHQEFRSVLARRSLLLDRPDQAVPIDTRPPKPADDTPQQTSKKHRKRNDQTPKPVERRTTPAVMPPPPLPEPFYPASFVALPSPLAPGPAVLDANYHHHNNNAWQHRNALAAPFQPEAPPTPPPAPPPQAAAAVRANATDWPALATSPAARAPAPTPTVSRQPSRRHSTPA